MTEQLTMGAYLEPPERRVPWLLSLPLLLYLASLTIFGWSREYAWISKIFGYGAAVAFAVGILVGSLPLPTVLFWWTAYSLWILLSGLAVALYPELVQGAAMTMLQIAVLTTLVASYGSSIRRARAVAWVLAFGSLFPLVARYLGIAGIANVTFDDGVDAKALEEAGRFTGTVGQPNAFAMIMVYGAMAALLAMVTSGKRGKIVALGIIALQFVGIILSGSRGGFLVFAFLLAASYVSHFGRNIGQRALTAIGILLLVIIGLIVAMPLLEDSALGRRLTDSFGYFLGRAGSSGSGSERMQLLHEAIRLFVRNPIFGVGLYQFQYVSGAGMYPHNNFAVIFTESGLIGAILYFTPVLLAGWRLLGIVKSKVELPDRAYFVQLFACLCGVLAYGMFGGNWKHKTATCILGLVFGSMILLSRKRQQAYLEYAEGSAPLGSASPAH